MKEKTPAASLHPGRVLEAAGGVYTVRIESGEVVPASLRGRLKLESRAGDKVVAGDEVEIARDDAGGATIESVGQRRSMLARRAPGRSRGARIIVANPARIVAVFALARPAPNPRLLDRFLVTAEVNDLPAVVVANKSDLPESADSLPLFPPYTAAGYPVIRTSVKTGEGLDELRSVLCDSTSVVTGPSGVGKSSLLNAIEPGLALRIGAVSEAVGKGRHTTVTSRLIPLGCGGYVADTPGIRELGLWQVDQAMLADAFPEFREPAESCRFAPSCSHSHEPGCGVLDRVRDGTIAASRHESYLALLAEIQELERKRY